MEIEDDSPSVFNLESVNKNVSNCSLEQISKSNLLKYAIKGQGINKSFSTRKYFFFKSAHKILDNLNINVPRGQM